MRFYAILSHILEKGGQAKNNVKTAEIDKNVKASALGNGKISIEVALSGTEPMQEIGAKMIVVNEKQADGNYKAVYTFTPEKYTNLIKKNGRTFSFKGTYQGIAGKQYYITAQLYAKNAKASSTIWAGSQTVKA